MALSMQRLSVLASDVGMGTAICAVGDAAAQRYALAAGDVDDFDAKRCGAMASYGLFAAFPYHFYYRWLARNVHVMWQKTAVECLLTNPLFEIPCLTLWTGYFGQDLGAVANAAHLRDTYAEAFAMSLVIWVPSSALVFRYVPSRWHLVTVYGIGAAWDAAMSRLSFGDGRGASRA